MKVIVGASTFADADPAPLELLQKHGIEVVRNPYGRRMDAEEITALLHDADGLLAGLEPLHAEVLGQAPILKALARIGIGMDNVDVAFAEARGIRVSNTPDGPTQAVAELALAALMSLLRNLTQANEALHRGEWDKRIGIGLQGLKVLLVGYGRIGARFGGMLHGLGAEVMACDPGVADRAFAPVRRVTFDQGLAEAQVISLHASGNEVILDQAAFDRIDHPVMLLNCARAGLIEERALLSALHNGKVTKAWLDVFWAEPYTGPLQEFPQVLMTPHVSSYTRRCRLDMEMQAVRNLLRDLRVGNA